MRKALESYVAVENLPEIEMPDYDNLDYVLLEAVTIDSKTCAACGYMVAAAEAGRQGLRRQGQGGWNAPSCTLRA